MFCAIWYHLWNFKNLKITHGGVLRTKSNTPPWVSFTFLKLYKWYQIVQCIICTENGNLQSIFDLTQVPVAASSFIWYIFKISSTRYIRLWLFHVVQWATTPGLWVLALLPPWTHGLWGRGALLQNSTQLRAAQRSVLKFKLFVSLNFEV